MALMITVPASCDNVRFRIRTSLAFRVEMLSGASKLQCLGLSKSILRYKSFWAVTPDRKGAIEATVLLTPGGK